MFKITAKLVIGTLLTLSLIASNGLAFHKDNSISKIKSTEWDGHKNTQKDYELKNSSLNCTSSSEGILEKKEGEAVIDPKTGVQEISSVSGELKFEEIETPKIKISGYHLTNSINTDGRLTLLPELNSKNKLDLNVDWSDITLLEILKIYCLQLKTEERPDKFKGSYLKDFYTQVALDNGFVKLKDTKQIGDYNQKLIGGEYGEEILKKGIIINNSDAVWYVPDYLIDQYKQNISDIEKNNKNKLRTIAINEGNNSWISKNKQNYIDEFKEKLNEYEKIITDLETKRDILVNDLATYEKQIKNAKKKIKTTFIEANIANEDIKSRKLLIAAAEETFLSGIEFEEYDKRLEKIKDIKFKKYRRYLELLEIIKKAEKSKETSDFVGKTGFVLPLLEILGGNFKLISDKNGLIEDFNNLGELTSESIIADDDMDHLDKDIEYQINKLDEQIFTPLEELMDQYIKLKKDKSWTSYAIYFIIFLVIVGGVIYHFNSRKKLSEARNEAEERINNLKRDFDGKLRNTSDEIKSVSRVARSQQSTQNIEKEIVQEILKTAEEITASQYDELVFEYKEALEDFSKVAAFKQKWNGLALSRKERQDGTKTILVSSTRAFEKAEIWCVTFSDNYFAFPGSSVKTNMATYMNLDFEKASRDFKGVLTISTGSSYSTEPAVLRRGGAGFVVDSAGIIVFPN
tara:strand:+ start:34 stop:2097 length:2064 start_codon:yes stop_codon:yes gene_type:complete